MKSLPNLATRGKLKKQALLFSSTSLLVTDGHSIIVIDVTRKGHG